MVPASVWHGSMRLGIRHNKGPGFFPLFAQERRYSRRKLATPTRIMAALDFCRVVLHYFPPLSIEISAILAPIVVKFFYQNHKTSYMYHSLLKFRKYTNKYPNIIKKSDAVHENCIFFWHFLGCPRPLSPDHDPISTVNSGCHNAHSLKISCTYNNGIILN